MRERTVGFVLVCLLVSVTGGCAWSVGGHEDDVTTTVGTARMCQLLEVPRETLAEEHLTVRQALTAPGEKGVGVRAIFALLGAGSVDGAERFRPALRYLSRRWEEETAGGSRQVHEPSTAVISNAEELDRFLADGGCG